MAANNRFQAPSKMQRAITAERGPAPIKASPCPEHSRPFYLPTASWFIAFTTTERRTMEVKASSIPTTISPQRTLPVETQFPAHSPIQRFKSEELPPLLLLM